MGGDEDTEEFEKYERDAAVLDERAKVELERCVRRFNSGETDMLVACDGGRS